MTKIIDATLPDPRKVELTAENFWDRVLIPESRTNEDGQLVPVEPRTVIQRDSTKRLLSEVLESLKHGSHKI